MNDTVEAVVHRCSMALFVLAVSFVAKDVSGEAPVSVSSRHVCLPGRVMPISSAVAMPKSRYRLYDGGTQGGRDDMTVAAPHVPPVRPSVRPWTPVYTPSNTRVCHGPSVRRSIETQASAVACTRNLIDGWATEPTRRCRTASDHRLGPDLTRSQCNNRLGPRHGACSCQRQPTSDQSILPLITCRSVRRPHRAETLIFNVTGTSKHQCHDTCLLNSKLRFSVLRKFIYYIHVFSIMSRPLIGHYASC